MVSVLVFQCGSFHDGFGVTEHENYEHLRGKERKHHRNSRAEESWTLSCPGFQRWYRRGTLRRVCPQ
eukprot:3887721-Amphidinium_carterae.1